jgi:hypothetical protein
MGNYRYSLPEVTDSLNQGIKDRLDGKRGNAKDLLRQLEEEAAAGRVTAEDVRAGQEIFLKTDELRAKQAQYLQHERDFVAANPSFKNTPANWKTMAAHMTGDKSNRANVENVTATRDQLDEAFTYLAKRGLLELNKGSVKAEEARAINDRNEARERAAAFNEEEAYTMPLNELARRARGW